MSDEAGIATPWGVSQHAETLGQGIVRHETDGHGGLHLSDARNAEIPAYMRRRDGWYEEDCDWAIVACVHPDGFNAAARKAALETLKDWRPDAWERWTGRTLEPGQSMMRDRENFERVHARDQVVIAAWAGPLDGQPKFPDGFVLTCATTGGRRENDGRGSLAGIRETWHLVPEADYKMRGPNGYVIPAATPETEFRPYPMTKQR